MRKLLLALGLITILLSILVLGRLRPGPPMQLAESPAASPAGPESEVQAAGTPADQLIVLAVGDDGARAQEAYRQLEQGGFCPYLLDSPESPVGLAGAAYGLSGHDAGRVRDTISLLVKLGCDIDQYSAVGLTPLHGAIVGRQHELLRLLLELGADPKLRTIYIPGSKVGHGIANLDAYGVALVLRSKFPDDAAVREILKQLQAGT